MSDDETPSASVNSSMSITAIINEYKKYASELEKFAKEFDLFIQVFRRSGNLWLETTATDNWSLHHQNEQGRELSGSDWRTKDDVSDYHEQE